VNESLIDFAALRALFERCPGRVPSSRPDDVRALLSTAELELICWQLGPSLPSRARIVRAGQALPFRGSGREHALAWARAGLSGGGSLILDDIGSLCPRIDAFAAAIERELCPTALVNAYLTPPDSRANDLHFDTHDVLVVQVGGSKSWRVYSGQPVSFPVLGQRRPIAREEAGEESVVELRAGDVFYLPRGVPHEAFTTGSASLHLSVGLRPTLVHEVLGELLQEDLGRDAGLRRAVRPERNDIVEWVQALATDPDRLRERAAAVQDRLSRRGERRGASPRLVPDWRTGPAAGAASAE